MLRGRLAHIVQGSARQRLKSNAGSAPRERAADDDLDVEVASTNLCKNFQTVHARHFDVEQDQVGVQPLHGLKTGRTVRGHTHEFYIRARAQDGAQQTTHHR